MNKLAKEITGLMRTTALVIECYIDQKTKCHNCGADTNVAGMFLRLRPDITVTPKPLDKTAVMLVCYHCRNNGKMIGEEKGGA